LEQLEIWLAKEPNQTEVIIIRRRDNEYCVKIEYGNTTTVPAENHDLRAAISEAVTKADTHRSGKRKEHEENIVKTTKQPTNVVLTKKPVALPGMVSVKLPGMN
jgi:hypothetical protein